ncbi:S1C family serine protease [Paenibacillus sp. MCAF20]
MNGHVVGINSMKIADFGVEGIGFAIPINNAMPVIESLLKNGFVPRPYLGVYTMDLEQYWEQQSMAEAFEGELSEEEDGGEAPKAEDKDEAATEEGGQELGLPDEVYDGVIVLEAVGPALDAGLAFNDVIVKLDRQSIGSTMELRKYLYDQKEIGDEIEVTFYREGELKTTKFKLGVKDDEE